MRVFVCSGCRNKAPQTGSSNNKSLSSCSSWRLEAQDQGVGIEAYRWHLPPVSSHGHPSACVCVLISSYKDATHWIWATHMNSFNLSHLFKDTVSKYKHILRSWRMAFHHMNLGAGQGRETHVSPWWEEWGESVRKTSGGGTVVQNSERITVWAYGHGCRWHLGSVGGWWPWSPSFLYIPPLILSFLWHLQLGVWLISFHLSSCGVKAKRGKVNTSISSSWEKEEDLLGITRPGAVRKALVSSTLMTPQWSHRPWVGLLDVPWRY